MSFQVPDVTSEDLYERLADMDRAELLATMSAIGHLERRIAAAQLELTNHAAELGMTINWDAEDDEDLTSDLTD